MSVMESWVLATVLPGEMAKLLAQRARDLRMSENLKRETLATNAGVSLASLKRFERTGEASLSLVLKVAAALGRLHEFEYLFLPAPARSMADLERADAANTRKRGRR